MVDNKNIAIAGAGTMGKSIAQIFAQNDFNVVIYDLKNEYLERAEKEIESNLKTLVNKGIISSEKSEMCRALIKYSCDKECFRYKFLIIEAVFEDINVKKNLWNEISSIANENTIFATNTSGISVTEISKAVLNPERFIGMHWWNPPHLVPLVEVIKGKETTDDTANCVMEIITNVGKKAILVKKDIKGFIGNRLQYALLREALHIVKSGVAEFDDIDNVVKYSIGLRWSFMGPFKTVDMGGVDIFNNVSNYLFADLCSEKNGSDILKSMVAENKLGVKSGEGFYKYNDEEAVEAVCERDEKFISVTKSLLL